MISRDLRPAPREDEARAAPGYFSNAAFALSLIAGLLLGISIARIQGPLPQGNAEPWQLRAEDRQHYMIAIALEREHSGDTSAALDKLIALRPAQDPWAALASAACELGSRGYLRSPSGIQALRSAAKLYRSQGRAGCAERLLPADVTPTPDASEAASAPRTAQLGDDARPTALPTKRPLQQTFVATPTRRPIQPGARRTPILPCSPCAPSATWHGPLSSKRAWSTTSGAASPASPSVCAGATRKTSSSAGSRLSYGDAYADFQMTPDIDYAIEMAGARDPTASSLSTGDCYTNNRRGLKSYRVTFVET